MDAQIDSLDPATSVAACQFRTRADPRKLFDGAEVANNELGLITKYLAYECYRSRIDESFDLDGDIIDKLDILYWYLKNYGSHRRRRLPLSAAQVKFLNAPVPVVGFAYPVSIASFTFIRKELGNNWDMSDPKIARDAIYWWSVERSPELLLDEALVPQSYIDVLTTISADQRWLPHHVNYFLERYLEVHPRLNFFDLSLAPDRVAYIAYMVSVCATVPSLTRLLPHETISFLLKKKTRSETSLFDDIVSGALTKVNPYNLNTNTTDIDSKNLLAGDGKVSKRIIEAIESQGYSLRRGLFRFESAEGNFAACYESDAAVFPSSTNAVSVIGPFNGASGLSQATRLSAETLKLNGGPVYPVNFDMDNPAPTGFSSTHVLDEAITHASPINLIHLNAEAIPLAFAFLDKKIYENSYNIGYFFWELTALPKCHYLALDLLDEIWVSSEYNREIYAKRTNIPVVNVGMAVEPAPSVLNGRRADYGLQDNEFVFLTTFDSFSFVQRKNPIAVIRAFQEAFPPTVFDVKLIVKTQNRHKVDDPKQILVWNTIKKICSSDRRIVLINETMDYSDLLRLKSICDGYISLHRSEGWGFGMLEAMQLGVPVIATGHSGNLEFCTPETCLLVDYDLVEPALHEYIFATDGGRWANPHISHAAQHMQTLYSQRHVGDRMAARAAKFVKSQFSFGAIAKRYASRLDEIRTCLQDAILPPAPTPPPPPAPPRGSGRPPPARRRP